MLIIIVINIILYGQQMARDGIGKLLKQINLNKE